MGLIATCFFRPHTIYGHGDTLSQTVNRCARYNGSGALMSAYANFVSPKTRCATCEINNKNYYLRGSLKGLVTQSHA